MKKSILLIDDIEYYEVARYSNLLVEFDVINIVFPNNKFYSGKDINFFTGAKDSDICIAQEIPPNSQFDVLLVCSRDVENSLPILNRVIEDGKEIILIFNDQAIIDDYASKICYENMHIYKSKPLKEHTVDKNLYAIDIPIVVVAGMQEQTNKFCIQLELRDFFIKSGYKVSQISSKQYSELFGMQNFPEFMFSDFNEVNKIYAFNNIVYKTVVSENPDILIIGVPGGVMPFSNKIPGNFGITFHETMLSLTPDILIVSCLYGEYSTDFFIDFNKLFESRYGLKVDSFNIGNFSIDLNLSLETRNIHYVKSTYKDIDRIINNIDKNLPIFNVSNGKDGKRMGENILEILSRYSVAIKV